MRRVFCLTILLTFVVCSLSTGAAPVKPNIIFIIVDDMGYYDLGCYGSKTIRTPHIDRMAAEGMRFTDAYSGATVCAPARSTLMTGTHMGHTSVRSNGGGSPLLPEDVTVAEVLKRAGYRCGGFGKWGLGTVGTEGVAEKQGFDLFFGYYHQVHAHSYYTSHLFRNSVRVPLPGNESNQRRQYSHNEIYREAVTFIRDNADKPFFCYLPWTPPHAKYEFPQDDPVWDWYKDKTWNQPAKVAAAMDSMMDRQIGEIIALLKELKIDDNTIMFFCSDNGAAKRFDGIHNSCGKMQGFKRSMNEGGIRVPFIVRWPGRIKPGSVSDLPVYFPDVLPTLSELAGMGGEVPEVVDGLSMVPTLLGKGKQERHEYLFWEHGGTKAVRSGKWKGILRKGKPIAVFDLANDIGERKDLADAHPDMARRLSTYIKEAWTEPRTQKEPQRQKKKKNK